jgi:hypothetical protein
MTAIQHSTAAALAGFVLWAAAVLSAEPVPVRYVEGDVHSFLALRTLDGKTLADGDLIETVRGSQVTSRLRFRFRDGSEYDETATFSQNGHFRLISDRLGQKGPSFPRPLTMSIDVDRGVVAVEWSGEGGKARRRTEQMDLPPDVANGLLITLFKNMRPDSPPAALSFIAATTKPRLVKLAIAAASQERLEVAGMRRAVVHYVVKVEIGGIGGLVAPLVGQQPPDSHIWVTADRPPAFVKSEQPLYVGGPVWRIEVVGTASRSAGA